MDPRAWLTSVTFSDGASISLGKDDVVIIVGPNNAGKSAALRGIRDKFGNPGVANAVVRQISVAREASVEELELWLDRTTKRIARPGSEVTFGAFGAGVSMSRAHQLWGSPTGPLGELARFFCHLLTADERLRAADPPGNISLTQEPPQHPIHFLQRDDNLETRLSDQFKKAFGASLIVHRSAGSRVPVHVGKKPIPKPGQDRVSHDYVVELEKLPSIETQGDGMRSFAGVLLYTVVGGQTVLLVDEPEAFLHPPQARHLGRMMVLDKQEQRQLFVATHSGDVLRGVLDANSSNVRVIRLRRKGDVNHARELSNTKIKQLWSDPLLRYSNILEGLFHEKVIVCESDADCRFYNAVADAIHEPEEDKRPPDIMFTHCGGKNRLPMVVRSLRELDVQIAVVADFDVLSDEQPLRRIVEAAGGDWTEVRDTWRVVRDAVNARKPELSTAQVIDRIEKELKEIEAAAFPDEKRRSIQKILRDSSPWSLAKENGQSFISSGQPSQALKSLMEQLSLLGIFVVPVGELEGFCKTIGSHGPTWVNKVLEKDLARDEELDAARKFVRCVTSVGEFGPHT